MPDHIFRERLARAIDALTPAQQDDLATQAPVARGLKAAIAHVAGLPGPNVLSDILAGRVPGSKHRSALAAAVSTDLAWLEGTSEDPPDWAMPPIAAWRRCARRIADAARRGRHRDKRSDDSSQRLSGAEVRSRSEAEVLARALRCDPRDPAIADLLAGRFTKPPVALVWTYAGQLGLAIPTHREHLERGRDLWMACEDEFTAQLAQSATDIKRLMPPPALFQLMRAALVSMRDSRLYQGKDGIAVEDAIELLWRQQWFVLGRSRRDVPEAFTEEAGRKTWTKIREIRARYPEDGDVEGRYRSRQQLTP